LDLMRFIGDGLLSRPTGCSGRRRSPRTPDRHTITR
jgi:hypothetical protein